MNVNISGKREPFYAKMISALSLFKNKVKERRLIAKIAKENRKMAEIDASLEEIESIEEKFLEFEEDIESEGHAFMSFDLDEITKYKKTKREAKMQDNRMITKLVETAEEIRMSRYVDHVYEYIKLPLPEDVDKNGSIPFEHNGTECSLTFGEDSVIYPNSKEACNIIISRPEVYFRTKEQPERFPCECLCAVDDATFELMSAFDGDYCEKAKMIATYSRLSKAQKDFVASMAKRPVYPDKETKEASGFTPIRDIESLEMMYEVCKYTYKPEVRARIESLRNQLSHTRGNDRTDLINQLAFAVGIDTEAHVHPKRSYEECMAIMDKHIYGLREIKENVVEFIIAMQESNTANFRMLLVGPPGVGKTSFIDAIAECLGDIPVFQVDCSGVNVITMSGLIKSYGGAKAGKVMDGFFERGQTDIVLLLDELDKMGEDKEGSPYGALIKPLGPQMKYYDEYVADDTDVSATKFIATANDVSKIPGYILSRFENNVFYLKAYTSDEKLEIALRHVIPKKLAEYNLSAAECVFEEDAVRAVIDGYCRDEGVRELGGNITVLLRKILTDRRRGIISMPFIVTADYVNTHLKKKEKSEKLRIGFDG